MGHLMLIIIDTDRCCLCDLLIVISVVQKKKIKTLLNFASFYSVFMCVFMDKKQNTTQLSESFGNNAINFVFFFKQIWGLIHIFIFFHDKCL